MQAHLAKRGPKIPSDFSNKCRGRDLISGTGSWPLGLKQACSPSLLWVRPKAMFRTCYTKTKIQGLRESSRRVERAARYPRIEYPSILDPERVKELIWHPFRVPNFATTFPGVYASLRPPATFSQPFGLQTSLVGQVC